MAKNLEVVLDRMRQSQPLDVDQVDLEFRNPAAMRERFGKIIPFFARVEQEVQRDVISIRALLPHLKPHYDEFLDELWEPQEVPHGQAFDRVALALDLPTANLELATGGKIESIGRVGKASPKIHDVLEMVYLARGAMHERLTATGYKQFSRQLEDMGETGLVETMFKPIMVQEATHLQFYRESATATWPTLRPWQQRLARLISRHTYSPVGTGTNPAHQAEFGHVTRVLAGDSIQGLTQPVQRIAEELLANGESLPQFVMDSVRHCLESSKLQLSTQTS